MFHATRLTALTFRRNQFTNITPTVFYILRNVQKKTNSIFIEHYFLCLNRYVSCLQTNDHDPTDQFVIALTVHNIQDVPKKCILTLDARNSGINTERVIVFSVYSHKCSKCTPSASNSNFIAPKLLYLSQIIRFPVALMNQLTFLKR
jgi:hypothetical protein